MLAAQTADRWLYLFSSNQSPRYAQDVIDLLAYPEGSHYTFRYDAKYVEGFDPAHPHTPVPGTTLDSWSDLKRTTKKAGAKVIVIFSIQQAAKFHDPAFLPVRLGEVVETDTIGTRRPVTCQLGRILALDTTAD